MSNAIVAQIVSTQKIVGGAYVVGLYSKNGRYAKIRIEIRKIRMIQDLFC